MTAGRRGRRLGGAILFGSLGALAGIWIVSGVYVVGDHEEGMVSRLGVFVRSEGPGVRFHLPAPFEQVRSIPLIDQTLSLGGSPNELMLTRDGALLAVSYNVRWRVSDAVAYRSLNSDVGETVWLAAQVAMRDEIGRSTAAALMSGPYDKIQSNALISMRRSATRDEAGVTIDAVLIQSVTAPAEVASASQDVAKATLDAQSAAEQAGAYRVRVAANAAGEAAKVVQAAQTYKEQVVRDAQGQASGFDLVYAQYRRAPAITRQRIYIETMQEVLAHAHKVIIDAKGLTAPIVLPPQLFQPSTPPTSASVRPAGAP